MRDHKTIVPHKVETPVADTPPSFLRMFRRTFRNVTVGMMATAGVCALGFYALEEYLASDKKPEKKKESKEKILVLPFHRMRLVEKRSRHLSSMLEGSFNSSPFEIEVSELVAIIHAAAKDPTISSLYGVFGHGFQFEGGWAQVEEIRNALKIWRESHRTHLEPNVTHDKVLVHSMNKQPKPSLAYADTFSSPDIMGNKEYALACAFSKVFMQKHGELNLFGIAMQQVFLRSFMENYGIKAHVFKHGRYKNFPNMFTESGFTREHRQNIRSLVDQLDHNKRNAIVDDRHTNEYDPMVWKLIRKHGSFTGPQALELRLLDELPPLSPLSSSTYSEASSKQPGMPDFNLNNVISIREYAKILSKGRKQEKIRWRIHRILRRLAESSSAFEATIGLLGFCAPNYNISKEDYLKKKATSDKIALLKISGAINTEQAQVVVDSLQKIKQDPSIKAVILRVDSPGGALEASEAILQECKAIQLPLVCSMGNECASGGYFIATACDRIFALPSTITGSIGVFAIEFDFTGFAKKYGINVEHITTGPYSASSSNFEPLNASVKANRIQSIDRNYKYFKELVADSRGLDLKEVESLAQGKIWTGREANSNGLVDELGGLEKAIAFARREYTSGDAEVEQWPKDESFFERLRKLEDFPRVSPSSHLGSFLASRTPLTKVVTAQGLFEMLKNNPSTLTGLQTSGVFLTMDEESAISLMITQKGEIKEKPLLHPSIWL